MSSRDVQRRLAASPEPVLTDPDNPEWTQEDIARAVPPDQLPAAERDAIFAAFPNTAARFRGAQKAPTKKPTLVRLDADVLDYLRASGRGWQTRLNATLRAEMERAKSGKVSRLKA